MIIEADPVCNDPASVRQAFKAVPVRALLFQRADYPRCHAGLLRSVWRDELLLQVVAFRQRGFVLGGPAFDFVCHGHAHHMLQYG